MNYGLNLSNPAPVLSVSIIDKNTLGADGVITPESKILVGVLCALIHLTHPDVVSIPTQRIPEKLLDDYYGEEIKTGVEEIIMPVMASEIFKIQPGKNYVITDGSSSHDPIKYAVESILSKKLGASHFLELLIEQLDFQYNLLFLIASGAKQSLVMQRVEIASSLRSSQ